MQTSQIWNEFSDSLKRYINSRVHNQTVTDDILQETFVKIHLNINKIKQQESLKSWIYTIAHNTMIDYFKKQSKIVNKTINLQENFDENFEHSHKDCLLPLINNLPQIYREAIILSEINGLKQAEVAKILDISLSGTKSRIQRGRTLLKQGFMDCCDFKLNESGHLTGTTNTKEDCKVCNN
ncbi:RNA polymerase sigma factor SigZ [Urechidicola croceus]|uniref:RNA polymerase sigma factor SigZ n=1 Tax=Urechidicola croceus TaxID=1850246 RepID=A0A1D8P742_9FLAO|nr:RNA polymerase sigma factor SigZ [Urechidicola croceus]AOW20394.1 hypothetical protein LPB138_06780 [Urechidicola croceus]